MNKNYETPKLEIIFYDNLIKMLDSSVVIGYPWGSDNNVFIEE